MADEDLEDLGKESRFAHLLKPIRDLAENWNVDLAQDLDEYLDHLDRTNFAFEDDGAMLDFAEAALLIQSSACVYSKKVEYLHNLVYQALEVVRSKNRQGNSEGEDNAGGLQQPAGGRSRSGAAAAAAAVAAEAAEEDVETFLRAGEDLDDCDNIDMVDEDKFAMQASNFMRPPAALLALEDQGGSGGSGDGDAGLYRVATCTVHVSGALLLDERDGEHYDIKLQWLPVGSAEQHPGTLLMPSHGPPGNADTMPDVPAWQCAQSKGVTSNQAQAHDAGGNGYLAPGAGDDSSDNGEEGGGGGGGYDSKDVGMMDAELPADSGRKPGLLQHSEEAEPSGTTVRNAAAAGPPPRPLLQGQPGSEATGIMHPPPSRLGENGNDETAEERAYDPYELLDLDAPGNLPIRPLMVRPPTRTSSRVRYAKPGVAIRAAVSGLLHTEFAYALEFLAQLQPAAQQPARRKHGAATAAGTVGAAKAAAPAALFGLHDELAATEAEVAAWRDDAGDIVGLQDGRGGGIDSDDDNGDAPDDHWASNGSALADGSDEPPSAMRHGGMAPYPGWAVGGDPAMGGEAAEECGSYEDLCRAHIEGMIAAAAAQEVQTELAQRVLGWRQRIDPVLRFEESRRPFDIQEYGEKILTRLVHLKSNPKDGSKAGQSPSLAAGAVGSFGQVAAGLEKHEVSRLFSAMLQLINNQNVAMIKPLGAAPGTTTSFQLKLLDARLPHHRMGAGLAAGKAVGEKLAAAAAATTSTALQKAFEGSRCMEQANSGGPKNASVGDSRKSRAHGKELPKRQKKAVAGGSSSE